MFAICETGTPFRAVAGLMWRLQAHANFTERSGCHVECHVECRVECHVECHVECNVKCHVECQEVDAMDNQFISGGSKESN